MAFTAPAVRITSLPTSLLRFPPSSFPKTLPVPPENPTLAHPFTIPSDLYNALLSHNVPITIALIYASIVTYLNSVNAQRKYKPWAFSRTKTFKFLVVAHNVFLALYSAWTFVGMLNALRLSITDPRSDYGLAGTVDSVCRIHGPRGLGDAAIYNTSTGLWGFTNKALRLGADGIFPDSSDVGRIWNEGLAFYGWLFYISKFYEVIDTFIILAKGKKSSFLQTYHHAGAMMCMWAGIRFMAAPIWMFVMVNSLLHSIMYSYYTASSLRIKVPKWFKQTLTTLQITQFIVGASYAFSHLFIAYQIPVSVPHIHHIGEAASSLSQNAASAVSVATATASAGALAWLKKAAFRAAGREGLAENVLNEQGQTFGIDAIHAAQDFQARSETIWRDELQWVHCLDTEGQAFAILLNCMYLAPLTWLFMRFFVRAYLKRQERRRSSTASETAKIAVFASRDAMKGVKRQIDEVATEGAVTDDESVEDETTTKKKMNGNKSIENEVGDMSSPDLKQELKKDDSFVKIEADPDSPTEVRSFDDKEEIGGEENAGEVEGSDVKEARASDEGVAELGAREQKDDVEVAFPPEEDKLPKTYAKAARSQDPEFTADTSAAQQQKTIQEGNAVTESSSEHVFEPVTDVASGPLPDESAGEPEKEPIPDATAESPSDATLVLPENSAESEPELAEPRTGLMEEMEVDQSVGEDVEEPEVTKEKADDASTEAADTDERGQVAELPNSDLEDNNPASEDFLDAEKPDFTSDKDVQETAGSSELSPPADERQQSLEPEVPTPEPAPEALHVPGEFDTHDVEAETESPPIHEEVGQVSSAAAEKIDDGGLVNPTVDEPPAGDDKQGRSERMTRATEMPEEEEEEFEKIGDYEMVDKAEAEGMEGSGEAVLSGLVQEQVVPREEMPAVETEPGVDEVGQAVSHEEMAPETKETEDNTLEKDNVEPVVDDIDAGLEKEPEVEERVKAPEQAEPEAILIEPQMSQESKENEEKGVEEGPEVKQPAAHEEMAEKTEIETETNTDEAEFHNTKAAEVEEEEEEDSKAKQEEDTVLEKTDIEPLAADEESRKAGDRADLPPEGEAPELEPEAPKTEAPEAEAPAPESEAPASEAEAPEPEAEAPEPEAEAPEAEAPEAEAPEAPAPESEAPEAEAPEAEAPEAEAPEAEAPEAEAEAPEPGSPKIEAPEAEPETPEAEAPKTEAPEPEPETPEAEAPAQEAEAPKTEAPKPESETPGAEVPAPEAEAPKTEPEAPASEPEAPASEPEAPAPEAPEQPEQREEKVPEETESEVAEEKASQDDEKHAPDAVEDPKQQQDPSEEPAINVPAAGEEVREGTNKDEDKEIEPPAAAEEAMQDNVKDAEPREAEAEDEAKHHGEVVPEKTVTDPVAVNDKQAPPEDVTDTEAQKTEETEEEEDSENVLVKTEIEPLAANDVDAASTETPNAVEETKEEEPEPEPVLEKTEIEPLVPTEASNLPTQAEEEKPNVEVDSAEDEEKAEEKGDS